MKLSSLKINRLKEHFSYRMFVYGSFGALAFLTLCALILDGWVFYAYSYTVLNKSVSSDYSISLKQKDLTDIISIFEERQKKIDSISKTGVSDLPEIFR